MSTHTNSHRPWISLGGMFVVASSLTTTVLCGDYKSPGIIIEISRALHQKNGGLEGACGKSGGCEAPCDAAVEPWVMAPPAASKSDGVFLAPSPTPLTSPDKKDVRNSIEELQRKPGMLPLPPPIPSVLPTIPEPRTLPEDRLHDPFKDDAPPAGASLQRGPRHPIELKPQSVRRLPPPARLEKDQVRHAIPASNQDTQTEKVERTRWNAPVHVK